MSLSALGSVVAALTANSKHVPYRDSKLTHLLKDSLGGNCNTSIVATIAPTARAFDDSVSTLKFADRASSIVNNAVKNVTVDLAGRDSCPACSDIAVLVDSCVHFLPHSAVLDCISQPHREPRCEPRQQCVYVSDACAPTCRAVGAEGPRD